jgi:hypothetical protein
MPADGLALHGHHAAQMKPHHEGRGDNRMVMAENNIKNNFCVVP